MYQGEGKWAIDINIPLMCTTLKNTIAAICVYDGTKEDHLLSEEQKKLRVNRIPTVLEYLSYILFTPTCIIGPCFEFRKHLDYINNEGDYAVSIKKTNRWPTVGYKFLLGNIYTVVYVVTQNYFDYKIFYEDRKFEAREYLNIVFAFTMMFRYYIGWLFTESNMALSGMAWDKEKQNYEGTNSVDSLGIVLSPDPLKIFKVMLIFENLYYLKELLIF